MRHPSLCPIPFQASSSSPAELKHPWRTGLTQRSLDVGDHGHGQFIARVPLEAITLVRLANPRLASPALGADEEIDAIGVRAPVYHTQPFKLGRSEQQAGFLAQLSHRCGADRLSGFDVPAGQAVKAIEKAGATPAWASWYVPRDRSPRTSAS